MAYDISANPLLVGEFTPTDRAAQQRVAEVLLGFTKVAEFIDSTKHQQAEDAIALQVSYQLECGVEAYVLSEVIRGARRRTYRGGTKRMAPIHPVARRLAAALLTATSSSTLR